jgi:hypothetical protein
VLFYCAHDFFILLFSLFLFNAIHNSCAPKGALSVRCTNIRFIGGRDTKSQKAMLKLL